MEENSSQRKGGGGVGWGAWQQAEHRAKDKFSGLESRSCGPMSWTGWMMIMVMVMMMVMMMRTISEIWFTFYYFFDSIKIGSLAFLLTSKANEFEYDTVLKMRWLGGGRLVLMLKKLYQNSLYLKNRFILYNNC